MDDDDRITWRPKKVTRVGVWAIIVSAVVAFLLFAGSLDAVSGVLLAALLLLGPAVPFLVFILRARITIDHETLEICNLGIPTRYRLADVVSVVPGYWGLDVRFVGGERRIAGAAQKSQYTLLAGHAVRSDRIAAEILNRARGAPGQAPRAN